MSAPDKSPGGELITSRIETNALKFKPTTRAGVMVSGGGYQGKTECVCEIAAAFEEHWLDLHDYLNPTAQPGFRDLHAPVADVQTPVTAKPTSTCKAIESSTTNCGSVESLNASC